MKAAAVGVGPAQDLEPVVRTKQADDGRKWRRPGLARLHIRGRDPSAVFDQPAAWLVQEDLRETGEERFDRKKEAGLAPLRGQAFEFLKRQSLLQPVLPRGQSAKDLEMGSDEGHLFPHGFLRGGQDHRPPQAGLCRGEVPAASGCLAGALNGR